jgi:hypothetical protein
MGRARTASETNPVGRRLPAGGKSPTRPKERAANAVNGKVRAGNGFTSSSTTTKTSRQAHAKGQAVQQLRQIVGEGGGRMRQIGEEPRELTASGFERLCTGTALHQRALKMRWESEERLKKQAAAAAADGTGTRVQSRPGGGSRWQGGTSPWNPNSTL